MIEFALLFGLGFLSAALIVMLIAPAVQSRVVRYTENRIRATLPISPQEVRAQRDMARAVYAAENARTRQELVEERDRAVALQVKGEAVLDEMRKLQAANIELQERLDTMDVEAADLRSRIRKDEGEIAQLKGQLVHHEEKIAADALEAEERQKHHAVLATAMDGLRIDLSARDAELENLKFRLKTLRTERDALRDDLRQQTTRARDVELRLSQEESRVQRLEERLERDTAGKADLEATLERRLAEIGRLREKLKASNTELREANRALRDPTYRRPGARAVVARGTAISLGSSNPSGTPLLAPPSAETGSERLSVEEKGNLLPALSEETHNRAVALSERLQASSADNDDAIRDEMATIAANMIALTATSEGASSPIHAILSGKFGSDHREGLAARAKKTMASLEETAG